MDATLVLHSESTLTDRYQTTVPETVRKALGLNKRDKIRYTIQPGGQVVLSRAAQSEDDPVLGQFLNFHVIATLSKRLVSPFASFSKFSQSSGGQLPSSIFLKTR